MKRPLHLAGFALGFVLLLNFNLFGQGGWESIATPVTNNLILYQMSFPEGQNDIGYTGGSSLTYNGKGKILKTTDQGSTWEVIWENNGNGTGVSSIFFFTPTYGFAGTQGGNLMTTSDGGQNWTSVDIDLNNDQGDILDIEFWDPNNGVIATQYGGVYLTTNGGASWTPASTSFIAYNLAYADATTVFAVGNSVDIYRSTDGGNTWEVNYDGPGLNVALGIHFADSNHGLATAEEGNIFVTHDGGDTWNNYIVSGQWGLMRGAWVFDENNMYATGTPGQVYKTVDGGVNWTPDSPFDPDPSYYQILFTENGNGFVCGSGSSGGTILRRLVLNFNLDEATNVSCNGGTDGSIEITAYGGTPPYSFLWSNAATTEDLTGLAAGVYSCTITDGDGETKEVGPVTITEPPAITMTSTVVDESADGADDGSIDITPGGGTPPYVYVWSNGASTEDLSGLADGTYCVTITDANGCEFTDCATVMAGPSSVGEIEGLTAFVVAPNPVEDQLTVEAEFSSPVDLTVRLVNSFGVEMLRSELPNTNRVDAQMDMTEMPSGIYYLQITSLTGNQQIVKRVVKR